MMIIAIGLMSDEMLQSLRTRFGGFTPEAAYELFSLMMSDTPCSGVLKRWPGASGVDNDSRYATRARRALELLAARQQLPSATAVALSGAVRFFSPLVPRYYSGQDTDVNDSGGTGGGGTLLRPQRCRDLLNGFREINLSDLESSIDDSLGIFGEVGPAYTFENGRHLVEYMRSYVVILEEAVTQERFYASFFT